MGIDRKRSVEEVFGGKKKNSEGEMFAADCRAAVARRRRLALPFVPSLSLVCRM
jgi:hypothetical protein